MSPTDTDSITSILSRATRRNPIGATCLALLLAAFYAVPTWGMYGDIGWWALIVEPAMFAGIGAFIAAMNFATSF